MDISAVCSQVVYLSHHHLVMPNQLERTDTMSGYNADISQPAEKDDEPTPTPTYVQNLGQWELPNEIGSFYSSEFSNLTEEEMSEVIANNTLELPRLLATLRRMWWERRQEIQADDSRLTHIWEKAGEIAENKGYCTVFEEFMSELGTGYAREEEGYAEVRATVEVIVSIPLSIRKGDDVEYYLDSSTVQDFVDQATDEFEVQGWDVLSWNVD